MTKYIIKNQFDRYIYKKEHVQAIIKMVEYEMHEILLDGCKIIKVSVNFKEDPNEPIRVIRVEVVGLDNA